MRDWHSVLNRNYEISIDVRQAVIDHFQNNYAPVCIQHSPLNTAQSLVYPSKIGAVDFFDPTEGSINLVVMRDPKSGALFAIEKDYIEEANNTKGECKVSSPYSPGDVLQIYK